MLGPVLHARGQHAVPRLVEAEADVDAVVGRDQDLRGGPVVLAEEPAYRDVPVRRARFIARKASAP